MTFYYVVYAIRGSEFLDFKRKPFSRKKSISDSLLIMGAGALKQYKIPPLTIPLR